MLVELLVMVIPIDGSKGFEARKEFSTVQACMTAGQQFKEDILGKMGNDVRVEFRCTDAAATSETSDIMLWRSLRLGMRLDEVTAELQKMQGVTSVTENNGTLRVKTDRNFTLAGTQASIFVSFGGNGLSGVYLKSAPYCSYVGSAGTGPAWDAREVLSQKYKMAVDYPGLDKDYTDGKVRVQLRETSDSVRCGSGIQQHYTIGYVAETQARSSDEAQKAAADQANKRLKDEF